MSVAQKLQTLFASTELQGFNSYSSAILGKLRDCHTAKMGYNLYKCASCANEKMRYRSCGNRHCPNCGNMKKELWVESRTQELLPTAYYHVVFTLPHEWNSLILGNRKEMFKILFDAASSTLLNFGKNDTYLGASPGITMVLHTWGQDLSFHPHVHCIVSGGGYKDDKWVKAKREKSDFIFPTSGMRKMYKAIFLKLVRKADFKNQGINMRSLLAEVGKKEWNVYAKAPFAGPAQVIEYLGRYTHKIAITHHRIKDIDAQGVRFSYKDYADNGKKKEMVLSQFEFLRRFEMHILPCHFVKIRHYGYLQNRNKKQRLKAIRAYLELEPPAEEVKIPVQIRLLEKYGKDFTLCECCGKGRYEKVATIFPRQEIKNKASP
jgi:hypothetical protein